MTKKPHSQTRALDPVTMKMLNHGRAILDPYLVRVLRYPNEALTRTAVETVLVKIYRAMRAAQ